MEGTTNASEEIKPVEGSVFLKKHFPLLAKLPYPGKYDDLGSTGKEILSDDSFEGFRTELTCNHSEKYNSSHIFHLFTPRGENTSPHYLYNIFYNSDNTFCFARIDNERKLFCKFGHSLFNKKLNLHFVAHMPKDLTANASIEADYKLPFASLGFKADKTFTRSFSVLTSLPKNFSFGYEYTIVPEQQFEVQHFALRYQKNALSYLATINTSQQLNLSCTYKKNNLEAVSDFMVGPVQVGVLGTQFGAGFKYFFKNNILRLKGDSTGHIVGTYEEGITNFMKISYSASINYLTSEYKFGIGLSAVK
ncbi:hypothetical protein DLAC_10884 [Tieghemostelium lacteum]|uniref:Mitochondrial import receptor subunit TOM40 n=1 Tax=Tieghemostelium lacteum TaxID=361077 RepID=A0A151Z2N7_TIELA|nr:hypothetical protein DLAC_10884 [Tieghemostelium lacteum]|eukprot:KYQ88198.1 hypothetical protein DLAC_10884 [Tieghemostelium lacteum]